MMDHGYKTSVSVIVPTYNRKELLKECLNSLLNQTYPKDNYEIIVVDDGSTDDTEKIVKELSDKAQCGFRYFKQENKGPAAARNLGIKKAREEVIAFTDDDCIANKGWLDNIMECFTNNVAGVEGRIITTEDKTPFTHHVENLHGGSYLTANIAYRKQILLEVGLFDETFPFPSAEDFELAFKILQRNYNVVFCEDATVIHPPIRESLKKYFKTRKYFLSTIKLYKKYPEFMKKRYSSILNLILFYMLVHPFAELNKWKGYFLKHPWEAPLFFIKVFLNSLYATYVLISYLIDLFFRGEQD
jgi:glycosyltransferase involved in cell wall biosynthesis